MYKKRDIDSRLRDLGAEPLYKQGWDYATTYRGVRIPSIKVTHPGNEVPDDAISKLARKIAEIGGLNLNDVKATLKGRTPKPSLDTKTNLIILTLIITLIVLVISRTKFLTGAVIGNIPPPVFNGLIILIVFLILGLLLLKFRQK